MKISRSTTTLRTFVTPLAVEALAGFEQTQSVVASLLERSSMFKLWVGTLVYTGQQTKAVSFMKNVNVSMSIHHVEELRGGGGR